MHIDGRSLEEWKAVAVASQDSEELAKACRQLIIQVEAYRDLFGEQGDRIGDLQDWMAQAKALLRLMINPGTTWSEAKRERIHRQVADLLAFR